MLEGPLSTLFSGFPMQVAAGWVLGWLVPLAFHGSCGW
jgi:hypothetical protein